MAADRVLLTGTTYSGSTLLAQVLMEASCDFGQGDPLAGWAHPIGGHGLENPKINDPSLVMYRYLWDAEKRYPDFRRAHEAIEAARSEIAEARADWPPFVKSPAMGQVLPLWLDIGWRPTAIIICYRRFDETLRSFVRRGQTHSILDKDTEPFRFQDDARGFERVAAIFGTMMEGVIETGAPFVFVKFPESVEAENAPGIYDLISSITDLPCTKEAFLAAHKRVASADMVNVRAREMTT